MTNGIKLIATRKIILKNGIFERVGFLKMVREIYLLRANELDFNIIDATLEKSEIANKIINLISEKINQ